MRKYPKLLKKLERKYGKKHFQQCQCPSRDKGRCGPQCPAYLAGRRYSHPASCEQCPHWKKPKIYFPTIEEATS